MTKKSIISIVFILVLFLIVVWYYNKDNSYIEKYEIEMIKAKKKNIQDNIQP